MNILIVDDQKSARRALARILEQETDITLLEAASLSEARATLETADVDLAFVDIRLSDDMRNTDGLTLVRDIKRAGNAVSICLTAAGEMSLIREAMRAGAYDYILKDDLCSELIVPVVQGLRDKQRLEREVETLRARVASGDTPLLVGSSASMERLRADLRLVALSDRPVLVTGPTGAGKEAVVRALHALGASPEALFLDVNCAAIPEALMESQLFGHEKGSFTGADRRTNGYLAAVGRGTLFLDEVAELTLTLQAKLLRVLETRLFRPVGSTNERSFHGRVVAATHRDLAERVQQGAFREDLYYRLNVIELRVPPLDDHPEDIPLLVAHFLRGQSRRLHFTAAAQEAMMRMRWPGNVRQLRNLIDRLLVFAENDTITIDELARVSGTKVASAEEVLRRVAREVLQLPIPDRLSAMQTVLMDEALAATDRNKSAAARMLGVHRKVIERRVGRDSAEFAPESGEAESEP
ncbi:MAG TPA: sigma-54 dependent transcriptional regulator [Polyangiaceae bacterium]|nr:sigma-54 dependent transcriptional regulator [Polyangiaceae bacterium]